MSRRRTGHLYYQQKGWAARCTVTKEGEPVQIIVDLGTHDRQVAKRRLARWLREQHSANPPTPFQAGREETVAEYAAEWVERRRAAGISIALDEDGYIRNHLGDLGGLLLSQVKPSAIRALLDDKVTQGYAKNSVAHFRAFLHRLFKSMYAEEIIPSNPVDERAPMPRMREVTKERCILSDAEFAQYMASPAGSIELKLMALVARVEGGMRTSDIIRWDWSMVDRVGFFECFVPRSKTGKPQRLEVPEVLRPLLRARWEAAGKPESGPVFPVQMGKRAGEMRSTRGISFARRLRRDLWRAGVMRHRCTRPADAEPIAITRDSRIEECCPGMRTDPLFTETATTLPVDFHSFRRAFNTALAEAGVNVQQAMHLASHSDPRVHQRYVMSTAAMRRIPEAAIPRLSQGLFGSVSPNADSEEEIPLLAPSTAQDTELRPHANCWASCSDRLRPR